MRHVTFYIMDGSDGLKFDLSRNSSDNKISCTDADDVFYSLLLLQNTEKSPWKYKELFDDIITYLLDDGSIGKHYHEDLKNINDSDKKKIVF